MLFCEYHFNTKSASSINSVPESCINKLNTVLESYFTTIDKKEIAIALLPGGHSNISLLITANNQRYVLRIKKELTALDDLKREIFAMRQAAELGLAPQVYYVSNDYNAVLMEYIPVRTLSTEQAKQPDIIIKIARAVAKIHQMPLNPYPSDSSSKAVQDIYDSIADTVLIKPQLDQAMSLMRRYEAELVHIGLYVTTTHGDLNPRNILLYEDQVFFIDWEYSCAEDPFMDISYLALRLDYTQEEEMLFLESYLQHVPSEVEVKRYYLAKKLNYAQLVIFFFSFALREQKKEKSVWDTITPLKSYDHYVKLFVDDVDTTLSLSQFYYDVARWCLMRAEEI